MNLMYLGDALDHWKGSLFESLQREKLVNGFAVDPMASDLSSWRDEDFQLLARLLRIDSRQVLHHNASLSDRQAYFDEIKHVGDLFLDPDTGVATGHVSRREQYVMPGELARLLDQADRMVLVYQHVRAIKVSPRIDGPAGLGFGNRRRGLVLVRVRDRGAPVFVEGRSAHDAGGVSLRYHAGTTCKR